MPSRQAAAVGNPIIDSSRILATALLQSSPEGKFSPSRFFDNWFKRKGQATYFLFKKNLAVTNIQYAELLALVRHHATPTETQGSPNKVQYVSVNQFKELTRNLVGAHANTGRLTPDRAKALAVIYWPVLRTLVAVGQFHGSANVFLPPTLNVDLATVCSKSGYVHSCGYSVYTRNIDKARTSEFLSAIDQHLGMHPAKPMKIFFSIYAHEDFTKHDRYDEPALRNGLDDVKIHVEKYFMGKDRLVTVLEKIRKSRGAKLKIPEPGDYRKMHPDLRCEPQIVPERSMWLVVDRSLGESSAKPGDKRYYICYDQRFFNENPLHLFDENKPAWIDHTTMPHTLAGAMINVTMPWWPARGKVAFVDPFAGTGTTLLEAMKYERITLDAGDIEPMAPQLLKDNYELISMPANRLKEYVKHVEELANAELHLKPLGGRHLVNNHAVKSFREAKDWLEEARVDNRPGTFDIKPKLAEKISVGSLKERLAFYLCLRTEIRHDAAIQRKSELWGTAFVLETELLLGQMKHLVQFREKMVLPPNPNGPTTRQSSYSTSASLGIGVGRPPKSPRATSRLSVRDARDLQRDSYDVIITDPPYGFNTESEGEELAKLYTVVIEKMVQALRADGQLVFCLADQSHTGRNMPSFVKKEFIDHLVHACAGAAGKEVIAAVQQGPDNGHLSSPPFYWEAERALRRAILHYRIRNRADK